MAVPKIIRGKKLLVASMGVAAISYACGSTVSSNNVNPSTFDPDSGNADGTIDDDAMISSGNLAAPVDSGVFQDSGDQGDGGSAADASDGGDAGTD